MKTFCGEIRETGCGFWGFIKDRKGLVLFTCVFSFLSYGALFIYAGDILTDAEAYITYFQHTLDTFMKAGRFGLVFSKLIFSTGAYAPFQFIAYTIIAMSIACLLFDFCVQNAFGKDDKRGEIFYYIFNALYLVSPVFPYQFYFKYQAFEVAAAFCFCIIGAGCAFKAVYEKKSIWWCVPSLGFMIWGFATYQVLVSYYIALNAGLFVIYYLFHKEKPESAGKVCVQLTVLFLTGLTLYLLLSKLFILICYGTGISAQLSDNYVYWGKESFSQCVRGIVGDIGRVVKQKVPCYSILFAPIEILFAISAGYLGCMKKKSGYGYFLIAVLLIPGSTFFMTFLLGRPQAIRAQLVFPFAMAFCAGMLVVFAHQGKKVVAVFMTVLMTLFIGNQLELSNYYNEKMHTTSAQDKSLAEEIYRKTRIYRGDTSQGPPMVFLGKKQRGESSSDTFTGEALGLSFFEIDYNSIHGSIRIARLMSGLGMDTTEPSIEQYEMSRDRAKQMPCWPEEGSIVFEQGVIIIKMSELE